MPCHAMRIDNKQPQTSSESRHEALYLVVYFAVNVCTPQYPVVSRWADRTFTKVP